MRVSLKTLALAGAIALVAWQPSGACGDKFLVVGRGRENYRAVHPASILIYADAKTPLPDAIRKLGIPSSLKAAGHKSLIVDTSAELNTALASGRYDAVVVDISDAATLEPKLEAAPGRPALLPLIYNPTGKELAQAEREYSCLMKSPSKDKDFLAVIDDAMDQRLAAREGGVAARGK